MDHCKPCVSYHASLRHLLVKRIYTLFGYQHALNTGADLTDVHKRVIMFFLKMQKKTHKVFGKNITKTISKQKKNVSFYKHCFSTYELNINCLNVLKTDMVTMMMR